MHDGAMHYVHTMTTALGDDGPSILVVPDTSLSLYHTSRGLSIELIPTPGQRRELQIAHRDCIGVRNQKTLCTHR